MARSSGITDTVTCNIRPSPTRSLFQLLDHSFSSHFHSLYSLFHFLNNLNLVIHIHSSTLTHSLTQSVLLSQSHTRLHPHSLIHSTQTSVMLSQSHTRLHPHSLIHSHRHQCCSPFPPTMPPGSPSQSHSLGGGVGWGGCL